MEYEAKAPTMKSLPTGKLPAPLLAALLDKHTRVDDSVVLGPRPGEDAAVIDLGEQYLVVTTDPITFATEDIGWYAVNVNANDVACCGAVPRWFLATVLLPEGADEALAEKIFAQINAAADALAVTVVGGHTEVTFGLERPLVVGQMMGLVAPAQLVTTGGAKPGDDLVLTKAIALEGTSILATEKRAALNGVLSAAELDSCSALIRSPGISVVADALTARDAGGVHALHDPTEGGLATGLAELANASQVGLCVLEASIPKVPHCERICAHLGLDVMGLIASGALLMSTAPESTRMIIDALAAQSIDATVIGSVTEQQSGCELEHRNGTRRPLPSFERDEITKVFA
jgi:hydrogenase expression/formation protein HypE